MLWALGAFALRIAFHWVQAKRKGVRFDAFDAPSRDISAFYSVREEVGGEPAASKESLSLQGKFW